MYFINHNTEIARREKQQIPAKQRYKKSGEIILLLFKKLFKFISPSFYRAKIGCLFIFQGHIAGYVTAKKKETDVFEYKKRRNSQFL